MAGTDTEVAQVSRCRLYGTYAMFALAYSLVLPGICLPQLHLRSSIDAKDPIESYFGATSEKSDSIAEITGIASSFTSAFVTEKQSGFVMIVWRLLVEIGGTANVITGLFVLMWGLIVPTIKLVTILLFLSGTVKSRGGIALVMKLSKWSLADAFLPLVWTGTVMMPTTAAYDFAEMTLTLKAGFYCFLGHCLLAQAVHHLILDLPGEHAREAILDAAEVPGYSGIDVSSASPSPASSRPARALTAIIAMVILSLLFMAFFEPSMSFYGPEFPYRQISLLQLLESIGTRGFMVPAAALLVFGICLPVLDLLLNVAEASGYWQRREKAQQLLESFCMLDVLMASMWISVLCVPGLLGESTKFRVYPTCWILGTCAIAWGIRAARRPFTPPRLDVKVEDP
eukprot:CAMPEP_0170594864 /NCGR_PEP_ID=MMETSP0224-20130122/14234_1 /TAXON_ID=285029 /ORGANISM="Togula jolla, Strain CCCM 725" /LENGTH=397 /DNA_ID=CAMNT_0010918963 /DNA_START=102 /DNA_END=1295 /DNA_ORIENTATION=-